MNSNIVSSFFKELGRRPELQSIIPMGYSPGIPIIAARRNNLCLIVPFLRYKITGEKDKTLVFPIRYVTEYLIPEKILIRFEDLLYGELAGKIDFNKACGLFRHKAIESLTRQEYNSLRKKTLEGLDKVAEVLLYGSHYSVNEEEQLINCLRTIVEPSLWESYRSLAPQFYNKYFTNGKN